MKRHPLYRLARPASALALALLLAACQPIEVEIRIAATATPAPPPTAESAALASPTPVDSAGAPAAPSSPTAPTEAPTLAARVLELVNQERATAGCPALAPDDTLAQVALAHSQDMADRQELAHEGGDGRTADQRLLDAGYQFQLMAENVAAGYTTPENVVQGWMESAGHRANILNCELRATGIAVAEAPGDPLYGIYWTQVFATPLYGSGQ